MVQQNVLNAARTETSYDFSPMFEYISDVVGNADWTVGDVEGPMDNRPDSAYSGNDPFNTPPQIMLAMKAAGVDMLTLANGQTLDMLFEGMQQTIANCKTAEMDYIGAFASAGRIRNAEDRRRQRHQRRLPQLHHFHGRHGGAVQGRGHDLRRGHHAATPAPPRT